MPVTPTYPGVYIEEIPSGVRTITGVATSITAFVGRAQRGPVDDPTEIFNYGDFERTFGGLWSDGPMSYAVRDFFLNGGGQTIIVRLFNPYYKSPDEQKRAEEAAKKVAEAATADPDANAVEAANKVREEADKYTTEPEKTAADIVAKKAEGVANIADATLDDVKQAATDALSEAAPKTTKQLVIGTVPLKAASPGAWGNGLRADIDLEVSEEVATRFGLVKGDLFNLTVRDVNEGTVEKFVNLTLKDSTNRIDQVLEQSSNLVRLSGAITSAMTVPAAAVSDVIGTKEKELAEAKKELAKAKVEEGDIAAAEKKVNDAKTSLSDTIKSEGFVTDGSGLKAIHFVGSEDDKTGIYALEKTDLFNLLCIPADIRGEDTPATVYQAAMSYCVKRRAMLIVDPPKAWSANKETAASTAKDKLGDLGLSGTDARNASLYFPRVRYPDPLRDNQLDTFVPCGMVAGVMARTDVQRGVWKAPAGIDAAINGTQAIEVNLTNDENGLLNPLGINCLRSFPVIGRVVWGARNLRGADLLADEYKYLPVRRTALFIEESLFRGTQWVVFEPNDEPLWAQIRLNVGAFMHNLFRQGAFQGSTPREAYLVKCDKETTTQNDINLGIVNIVVGFAPLKPAEFVIIKLQQLAGQIDV